MPRRRTVTTKANTRRPLASDIAGNPVEAATAAVLRLRDREIEIWQDRRQMVADLHDLEAATGRQVADGGNADEAARQLAEGEARLRVQDRAADEVAQQREAAVPLIWRAQAANERASETAKRADAQKRQLRTSQLLAELCEHEGCEYGPAGRQPGDGGAVVPGAIIIFNAPRTARLLAEADEHGRKAAALDRQEFNAKAGGGQVSATSIAELMVLGLGDGQRPFVSLREVERWAVEAEQAGRKRLRRIRDGFAGATPDPDTAPATWTLTWHGREMMSGESRVSFLGLAGGVGADNYVDSDAGFEQVGERSWMREPAAALQVEAE